MRKRVYGVGERKRLIWNGIVAEQHVEFESMVMMLIDCGRSSGSERPLSFTVIVMDE